MSRVITHVVADQRYSAVDGKFPTKTLSLKINRPGLLSCQITATAQFEKMDDGSGGGGKPVITASVPVSWKLLDPLGKPFTKTVVKMADLDRYRDVRGFIRPWSLEISSNFVGVAGFIRGHQLVKVSVKETIANFSAPPLVDVKTTVKPKKEFSFDLYRLGNLQVTVMKLHPTGFGNVISVPSGATLSLIRPNGTLHSRGVGHLEVNIYSADLKLSRGNNGLVQKWKLVVQGTEEGQHQINAQVFDSVSISKQLLIDRLLFAFGKNGEKLELKANWTPELRENRVTIKFNDPYLAETFDIHSLIDVRKTSESYTRVEAGIEYLLMERPMENWGTVNVGNIEILDYGYSLRFRNFKVASFKLRLEKSVERTYYTAEPEGFGFSIDAKPPFVHLDFPELNATKYTIPANLPALKLEVQTQGTISLFTKAGAVENTLNCKLPKLDVEIIFARSADGRIACKTWLNVKTDKGSTADLLINTLLRGYFIKQLNLQITAVVEKVLDHMMGGPFFLNQVSWRNDGLAIDYITDALAEKKPSPNYNPIVGHASDLVPHRLPELLNTWKSSRLTADPNKIRHMVVLMMENRSFDHVLGYLSITGDRPDVEGLTPQVIADFSDDQYKIQHLKLAGFASNAVGLKTAIPLSVGHHYDQVQTQIDGGSMKGFVKDFKNLHDDGFEIFNVHPQDVLGYYTEEELRFYRFFADEFAICDQYFCSHPGPTLPNRMFSLCGDLHYDRNGEPKLENSVDTAFFLSRDCTIFDLLDQYGISWRVYESFPSVSMLRMFSRYTSNNDKIRDIRNFEADVAKEGSKFPNVVFIDPAFHDAPANDDHPPADMLHGQHLIKNIYNALAGKKEVWEHLMFIVNYDEHGGLFDHVTPKLAEVYKKNEVVDMGEVGAIRSAARTVRSNLDASIKVTYGVRVPAFIVSPYVKRGTVYHQNLDHTSVLKTILINFCNGEKPFLSNRVNFAHDMGPVLSGELRRTAPKAPDLPVIPGIRTLKNLEKKKLGFKPMNLEELRSDKADFHDYLAFLGRRVKPF